jgi:hypothetical protein
MYWRFLLVRTTSLALSLVEGLVAGSPSGAQAAARVVGSEEQLLAQAVLDWVQLLAGHGHELSPATDCNACARFFTTRHATVKTLR